MKVEKESINNNLQNNEDLQGKGASRRGFITKVAVGGIGLTIGPKILATAQKAAEIKEPLAEQQLTVNMVINGKQHIVAIDSRSTLLDTLRENLSLFGTKKGCDHGQCGACTVLIDGRRVNSCLTLAAMCEGARVTTVEGLAAGDNLHPMQAAFIKHDAFQCGYCTPGQICSAVGLVEEGHAKTDEQIRESMSGNICRCGAYQNILAAIKEVQTA